MGPVQVGADGYLTVLLLCTCERMKADHKHEGEDLSAR